MPHSVAVPDPVQGLTFAEYFLPPLQAGTYLATAGQKVAGTALDGKTFGDEFTAQVSFAVQGLRYAMPPSYVLTRFPGPGKGGDYAQVLPHLVLTANTLPWQRSIGPVKLPDDATSPDDAAAPRYPWLALLVFDEQETGDATRWAHYQGTLQNLLSPASGTLAYPGLELEYGEQLHDPVAYIDVAADLFAAVVPRAAELPWLTHARTVADEAALLKATSNTHEPPAQEVAVVVANRLPRAGARSTCCLVSLESLGCYLPDQEGLPAGTTHVRLAVLADWSFDSASRPETFTGFLQRLDVGTVQVPYANATGTANLAVAGALGLGYTALRHHTRQSGELASWYRGPLLPFAPPATLRVPLASADALTHYNPTTGMADVSLGAAWQMGRLLALQDGAFASTLANWRRAHDQQSYTAFEQDFLLSGLTPDPDLVRAENQNPDDGDSAEPFDEQLLRTVIGPALAGLFSAFTPPAV